MMTKLYTHTHAISFVTFRDFKIVKAKQPQKITVNTCPKRKAKKINHF